jgi:hypothetical protein
VSGGRFQEVAIRAQNAGLRDRDTSGKQNVSDRRRQWRVLALERSWGRRGGIGGQDV